MSSNKATSGYYQEVYYVPVTQLFYDNVYNGAIMITKEKKSIKKPTLLKYIVIQYKTSFFDTLKVKQILKVF